MTVQPSKIEPVSAKVYEKIAAVQSELAHTGIGKDSENSFDRYKFRGIDAVYNALAPLLAKHGLCVLPRIVERESVERVSRKGEPMFYVTVTAEFDFVAAEDGSLHTVRTYGEAMDRSDKATNKAMSAAYKYAAFMAFAIPTEGDNDADATTPEVASAVGSGEEQIGGRAASPTGPGNQSQAKRENWGGMFPNRTALHKALTRLERELHGCGDTETLDCLTMTEEWTEFVKTCEEHAPHYLYGGDPAPEEFVGLLNKAQRMRDEFQLAVANGVVDLVRAG